jgi:hypothetical protein
MGSEFENSDMDSEIGAAKGRERRKEEHPALNSEAGSENNGESLGSGIVREETGSHRVAQVQADFFPIDRQVVAVRDTS